jgi:hypothetical protein
MRLLCFDPQAFVCADIGRGAAVVSELTIVDVVIYKLGIAF